MNDLICDLCQRTVPRLTRHHLIPRTRHKNKKNKKLFTRTEVRERLINICSSCHRNIHAHLTEKQLELHYNTIELLLAHPEIKKFTEWLKNKPGGQSFKVRTSRQH